MSKEPFEPRIMMAANICTYANGEKHLVIGIRHWDELMVATEIMREEKLGRRVDEEQGFIDQYQKFYTREEALELVKKNGQPFSQERNVGTHELYSEGVW